MPETSDELALYLHLARASEVRRRPLVRDKLLVLAAKTAVEMRLEAVAEHCRAKILAHNPGHILRNYATMSAALEDESFRVFMKRLVQAYPRERAEHMLRSLGIVLAGERQVYADDLEYAAALLGTTPERLGEPAPMPRMDERTMRIVNRPVETGSGNRMSVPAAAPRQFRWVAPLLALAATLLMIVVVALVVRTLQ